MSDKDEQKKQEQPHGEHPPEDHEFHIQIDRIHYKVKKPIMTGLELRQVPPAPIGPDRDLFEVVPGGTDRKIADDEKVEIRDGKRFFTAPAQINPGQVHMSLPQSDIACLAERRMNYSISTEANMTCVVFPNYTLPVGYDRASSDLLLRLQPGFPDVPPDMWWFNPAVRLANGQTVEATEVIERHLGKDWQRWSRHFNAGQWQSGIDSLESFLALIRKELERCAKN